MIITVYIILANYILNKINNILVNLFIKFNSWWSFEIVWNPYYWSLNNQYTYVYNLKVIANWIIQNIFKKLIFFVYITFAIIRWSKYVVYYLL